MYLNGQDDNNEGEKEVEGGRLITGQRGCKDEQGMGGG